MTQIEPYDIPHDQHPAEDVTNAKPLPAEQAPADVQQLMQGPVFREGLPDEAMDPIALLTDFAAHPYAIQYSKRMASALHDGGMIPKSFRGNRAAMAVAIMHGARLGLDPLQAAQGIAAINGVPSVWGDTALALVQRHGVKVHEQIPLRFDSDAVAICTVTRDGHETTRSFSYADAVAARLDKKQGPWQEYPKRMMQMRARSWALRDSCADLLKGLGIAEEVQDIEPTTAPAVTIDVSPLPSEVGHTTIPIADAPPPAGQTAPQAPQDAPESHAIEDPAEESNPEPVASEADSLGESTWIDDLEDAGYSLADDEIDRIERAAGENPKLWTSKAKRPSGAAVGDLWLRQNDGTLHVRTDKTSARGPVFALLVDFAAEEGGPDDDGAGDGEPAAVDVIEPSAPVVDDPEPDPEPEALWNPDPGTDDFDDVAAGANPPDAVTAVWVRPEGKRRGTAYTLDGDTFRPSAAGGTWARAKLASMWPGTEAELNERLTTGIGGSHGSTDDWRNVNLHLLFLHVQAALKSS